VAARFALFDLGNVVLDWEPSRLYSKLFAKPEECDEFLKKVCTRAWHHHHDAGVSFADNAPPLIAKFPQFESQIRAWGERWMDMFDGYVAGTAGLIERLAGRGVPVYGLSNMPAETWPMMLDHFPVLDRFQAVFVSGELGLTKPQPEIYQYALTRMGAPDPDDVLFIDDMAANIATARALDLRTHMFTNAAALEKALFQERLL
jgi:HAD superfamily hydrolase (TIGR01549 family)